MQIDQKLIDQINEKTPIVDLVSEYVSLAKRGKNFMGLCPFHNEKTPSFSVSPEKNIAKCMSCGEGGTPINFYRKIKNISFEEACGELAERAGIVLETKKIRKDPNQSSYQLMNEVAAFYAFNLKNSEKGQEAMNYLKKRQMDDALITHFMLGYAPPYGDNLYQLLKDKGHQVSDMIKLGVVKQGDDGSYYDLFSDRVIFPITDPKGHVVGLSGRTLNPKDPVKYINSPETPIFRKGQLLYHYAEALPEIRKAKQVVLYEGFFDCISSYAAGLKHGIATMGTALTKDQAMLIKQASPSVIIAYDGDDAGLKAADHAIPILEKTGLKVEVLSIPDKMDPDDFIKAYGPEAYDKLFGEYTKDAYAFRYAYYKSNKNLKDANDIKQFKTQVLRMIQTSDMAIRAIYIQKLAQDLGVSVDSLQISKRPPTIVEPTIPQKETKRMLTKGEKAERYLIIAMLRSKEVTQKVVKMLDPTKDFADHLTAAIRIKIEQFYEDHLSMDLNEFLDRLSTDQRSFMEDHLLKDMYYTGNLPIGDEDVEDYIRLIKQSDLKRRYDYLCEKLKNLEDYTEALAKERDQLKLQLMIKD